MDLLKNKYVRNAPVANSFTLMTFNLAVYHEMMKPYNKKFEEIKQLTNTELNAIREKLNGFVNIEAKAPDIICTQEDLLGEKDIIRFPLNYKVIASCQANKSDWAKDETTYLANKILIRNGFKGDASCISGIEDTCQQKSINIINKCVANRCTAIADLSFNDKKFRIANVHLCGGRFDDLKFQDLLHEKNDEITRVLKENPDIVVGDFNSYADKDHVLKHLKGYDVFTKLNEKDKEKFIFWASGVHKIMYKYGYLSAGKTSLGDTSIFGGMVDWIYYHKNSGLKLVSVDKIIAMCGAQAPYTSNVSDHNALLAKFEIGMK